VLADMAMKDWPELSRDGRFAVFARSAPPSQSILTVELATGRTRDAVGGVFASYPTLSPDGSRVYYTDRMRDLWMAPVAGRPSERIGRVYRFDHASPDGRYFLSHGAPGSTFQMIFIYDRQTGQQPQLLAARDRNIFQPRFSADGHWVTFLAKVSDVSTLY